MSVYSDTLKTYSDTKFRQVVGFPRDIFNQIVELVEADYRQVHTRRGRLSKLTSEDKVLITAEHWRSYPTNMMLAAHYGVDEKTIRTVIKRVEMVLMRSKQFHLPGAKELLNEDSPFEIVLVDATDTRVERPKKSKNKITRESVKRTR